MCDDKKIDFVLLSTFYHKVCAIVFCTYYADSFQGIVPTDTNYRNVDVSTCWQNMELGFGIEAQHI